MIQVNGITIENDLLFRLFLEQKALALSPILNCGLVLKKTNHPSFRVDIEGLLSTGSCFEVLS